MPEQTSTEGRSGAARPSCESLDHSTPVKFEGKNMDEREQQSQEEQEESREEAAPGKEDTEGHAYKIGRRSDDAEEDKDPEDDRDESDGKSEGRWSHSDSRLKRAVHSLGCSG
jgi:hypothetical protein